MGFDDDGRDGFVKFFYAYEGGAVDGGVLVDDAFAAVGEEESVVGFDVFCFASAEPDVALGVDKAEVAHAVPDGGLFVDF